MIPRFRTASPPVEAADTCGILLKAELISGEWSVEGDDTLTVTGPSARGRSVRYKSRSAACSHFDSTSPFASFTVMWTESFPCTCAGFFTQRVTAYNDPGRPIPNVMFRAEP